MYNAFGLHSYGTYIFATEPFWLAIRLGKTSVEYNFFVLSFFGMLVEQRTHKIVCFLQNFDDR